MICSLYVGCQIIHFVLIRLYYILLRTAFIIVFDSTLGCIPLIHINVLFILDTPPPLILLPLIPILLLLHCELDFVGVQCGRRPRLSFLCRLFNNLFMR